MYFPLTQLIYACSTNQDHLACSQILNLCAYSQAQATSPECQFFSSHSLTSMLQADASGFSLSATQEASIALKLVSYSVTGNYLGEKSLLLGDIMRCGIPTDSELGVTFGTNYEITCDFDFNNLIL